MAWKNALLDEAARYGGSYTWDAPEALDPNQPFVTTQLTTASTPRGPPVGSASFSEKWNAAGDVSVSTVNCSLPATLTPGIYVWNEVVVAGTSGVQLHADGAWPENGEVFHFEWDSDKAAANEA